MFIFITSHFQSSSLELSRVSQGQHTTRPLSSSPLGPRRKREEQMEVGLEKQPPNSEVCKYKKKKKNQKGKTKNNIRAACSKLKNSYLHPSENLVLREKI